MSTATNVQTKTNLTQYQTAVSILLYEQPQSVTLVSEIDLLNTSQQQPMHEQKKPDAHTTTDNQQ